MVGGPLPSPVIDTRPIQQAGQDSRDTMVNNDTYSNYSTSDESSTKARNGPYKPTIIPVHSSLPSPLSPPLSISPISFGPSMADTLASGPIDGSLSASLPPLPPSTSPSPLDANNNTSDTQSQRPPPAIRSPPAAPFIQTSPDAWLAHAAQQRRHLSTGSMSSTASTSSAVFSPTHVVAQSPSKLEFGESERVQEETGQEPEEQEPVLNVMLRPSELRASLMAQARRSSAKKPQKQPESMLSEKESRLSVQSNQSVSSAYDSHPSARSSTSSSISGWAPRARSSSVSSQGSNDSVNLDALIASGSDINEERPLELEEGDDVEWAKDQQQQRLQLRPQQEQQQRSLLQQRASFNGRSRNTTADSDDNMAQYDDHDVAELWGDSELPPAEEDEEFDDALREFSQRRSRSSEINVRGLSAPGGRRSVGSGRFPDGRNPFDLEADYMDTPAGLRAGSRSSNYSNYSGTSSNRSSIGQMPAPGVSRLPGASGLKAPSTRLAQPAARSMLAQPKATGSNSGITRPSGLQAPRTGSQAPKSGLQAPKSGLQAPRSGLQAPKAGSSIARPGVSGIAAPGRTGIANSRVAPPSRLPSNIARPNQIAPPSTGRGASAVTNPNRQSHLIAPSTVSRNGPTIAAGRSASRGSNPMSPGRSMSTPGLLASPARVSSGHSGSSYMTSPTSSHSSSASSLPSGRDVVSPLSQRLSNATGTSQLARPRANTVGRSVSMYGSNSLRSNQESHQQYYQEYEEDDDCSFLTPPQSPSSSKAGSRILGGIPRSGIAAPSRLVAPSVPTARNNRSVSPSPFSSGSNSGGYSSMLPRSHTPTRMQSGLLSPRAGRH